MRNAIFVLVVLLLVVQSGAAADKKDNSFGKSVAALLAANAADAASSWGARESNPILGDRFGLRGVTIKAGITGGVLLAEWAFMKKWPQTRRIFKWVNYLNSTGFSAVAIRNTAVR